jgi:hypothetical protein
VQSISRNGKVTVIQLGEPIGGGRIALQKTLGDSAQVGHSQIRVSFRDGWTEDLVQTLEGLVAFKTEVLKLSGVG